MFDISFSELMVIGAIALIVIGPARLPKVARTIGHLMGRAQRYVNDVKADIAREVELDELRKLKEQMSNAAQDVQTSLREGETALRATHEAVQSEVQTLADAATSATPTVTEAAEPAQSAASAEPAESAFEAEAPTRPAQPLPPSTTGTPT